MAKIDDALTAFERTYRETGNIRYLRRLYQSQKYTIDELERLTHDWMESGGVGDPYYRTYVGEGIDFSIADWIDNGSVGDVELGTHLNRQLETARMDRVSDYAAEQNFAEAQRYGNMTNTDYLRKHQDILKNTKIRANLTEEEFLQEYALGESTGQEFLATIEQDIAIGDVDPVDIAADTENLGNALEGARREVYEPVNEDIDKLIDTQAELWGDMKPVIKEFGDPEVEANADYFTRALKSVLTGDAMPADPVAKLDLLETSYANLLVALDATKEANLGDLQGEYSQIVARLHGDEEKYDTVLKQFESAEEQMGKWVRKARTMVRTGQIPTGNVNEIQDLLTQAEGVEDVSGAVRGTTWEAEDDAGGAFSKDPMGLGEEVADTSFVPERVFGRWEAGPNTTSALRDVGQKGLLQDVQNTYDVVSRQNWGKFWETNPNLGGRAAAEEELGVPELGVPEQVEMQEIRPEEFRRDGGDYELMEPELGEFGAGDAVVAGAGGVGAGFNRAMGNELMQEVMGGFSLGIAQDIGVGGNLSALMAAEGGSRKYDKEAEHWRYWDRRDKRKTRLEQDWIKQKVYAKIGSFWYEGTVQNVFLGDTLDPDSYMAVTINWDDPSGKTMDYNVVALPDRIRLASDGEVPLREGGITKYEPYTNPELTMYRKPLGDIREMEQVKGDDGLYHEVKHIETISTTYKGWERTGYKIIFTDGTSQEYWKEDIDWRPRGTIHTKERPKQPKYEWKTEWLKFLREEGLIPKNPNKKPGPKWRLEQRQRLLRKKSKTEKTSSLEDLRNAQIMSDFWQDDIDFYMGDYETQVDGIVEGGADDQLEEWGLDDNAVQEHERLVEMRTDLEDALDIVDPESEIAGYIQDTLETLGTLDQPADDEVDELVLMAQNSVRVEVDDEVEDEDEDDLDEPIGAIASAFAIGHDVTEEEAEALDATYQRITVGLDETPTSNVTGHALENAHPEGTEEHIQHLVETEGFRGLEHYFGYEMPTVYENYALGNYSWQHGKEIPAWLQPDLTNIYGGSEQYQSLVKKYENDYQMSRNLERVGTAVRAPNVLRYLNKTHNEMKSLWHNGTLDADKIEQITQGNAPSFSYNSQGHIVLVNDTTIDHGFNHNRNMVHSFNDSVQQVTHSQLNFAKEAASFSKVDPSKGEVSTANTVS